MIKFFKNRRLQLNPNLHLFPKKRKSLILPQSTIWSFLNPFFLKHHIDYPISNSEYDAQEFSKALDAYNNGTASRKQIDLLMNILQDEMAPEWMKKRTIATWWDKKNK